MNWVGVSVLLSLRCPSAACPHHHSGRSPSMTGYWRGSDRNASSSLWILPTLRIVSRSVPNTCSHSNQLITAPVPNALMWVIGHCETDKEMVCDVVTRT